MSILFIKQSLLKSHSKDTQFKVFFKTEAETIKQKLLEREWCEYITFRSEEKYETYEFCWEGIILKNIELVYDELAKFYERIAVAYESIDRIF